MPVLPHPGGTDLYGSSVCLCGVLVCATYSVCFCMGGGEGRGGEREGRGGEGRGRDSDMCSSVCVCATVGLTTVCGGGEGREGKVKEVG